MVTAIIKEEMSQDVSALIQWARSYGAEIPDQIEFVRDEYKGICAICRENVQETKIKIPSSIIISRKDAVGQFAPRFEGDNTGLKFLVPFWKLQDGGKFQSYLGNLPLKLDSALVWNPDEWQLLKGTNLGNSVRERLGSIYLEWVTWIKDRELPNDSINLDEISDQQLYRDFLHPASRGQFDSWSSFPAFLWSHLVFLSRAFPEYVVHTQCEEGSMVLLPIIDLLNHDSHSKVQWYGQADSFCFEKYDGIASGQELFNNYGAKGNEELLSGYGFVKEDNEFDYVALKMKLPLTTTRAILEQEPDIQLPTLDDYTTFVFEKPRRRTDDRKDPSFFEDGITFFINMQNENCLNPLLDLFSYLSKTDNNENWMGLRPRLQGLQSLRAALKLKQEQASVVSQAVNQEVIDPFRRHCAYVYRSGQLNVLKHAISSLKKLEKDLLTRHKHELLNLKKIIKDDPGFVEHELPMFFQDKDQDEVSFDDTLELLVLWLISKRKNNSFQEKHKWVKSHIESDVRNEQSISEEAKSLYSHFFSHDQTRDVTLQELSDAYNFIMANSFTRFSSSSSSETILVQQQP